jgi:hypothetical protein
VILDAVAAKAAEFLAVRAQNAYVRAHNPR